MGLRVWLVLVLGAVVSIAFLWLTDEPLGVPGEWEWGRIRFDDDRLFDSLLGCGVACAAAGVYLWLAWLGSDRIGGCSRAERAAWLIGLVMAGFAWLWFVQTAPPKEIRSLKPTWVLYDPGASGYFFEACHGMDDARSFLATYENRMAGGDVLHVYLAWGEAGAIHLARSVQAGAPQLRTSTCLPASPSKRSSCAGQVLSFALV